VRLDSDFLVKTSVGRSERRLRNFDAANQRRRGRPHRRSSRRERLGVAPRPVSELEEGGEGDSAMGADHARWQLTIIDQLDDRWSRHVEQLCCLLARDLWARSNYRGLVAFGGGVNNSIRPLRPCAG
jgi:hypothetical protein